MAAKLSVVLMYETFPRAMPLGLTEDPRIKILVKQQIILEAEQALKGAEITQDPVIIASFRAQLDKLRKTLDLLIPPEFEALYRLESNDDG